MSSLFVGEKRRSVISQVYLLIAIGLLMVISCSGESDKKAREKLNVILKDDLESIIEGIDPQNLIENVHYDLVSYKTYDEGKYSKLAVADFYFLKNVNVKIVRKYRYHMVHRMWDRYFNEYSFLSDTTDSILQKK